MTKWPNRLNNRSARPYLFPFKGESVADAIDYISKWGAAHGIGNLLSAIRKVESNGNDDEKTKVKALIAELPPVDFKYLEETCGNLPYTVLTMDYSENFLVRYPLERAQRFESKSLAQLISDRL